MRQKEIKRDLYNATTSLIDTLKWLSRGSEQLITLLKADAKDVGHISGELSGLEYAVEQAREEMGVLKYLDYLRLEHPKFDPEKPRLAGWGEATQEEIEAAERERNRQWQLRPCDDCGATETCEHKTFPTGDKPETDNEEEPRESQGVLGPVQPDGGERRPLTT